MTTEDLEELLAGVEFALESGEVEPMKLEVKPYARDEYEKYFTQDALKAIGPRSEATVWNYGDGTAEAIQVGCTIRGEDDDQKALELIGHTVSCLADMGFLVGHLSMPASMEFHFNPFFIQEDLEEIDKAFEPDKERLGERRIIFMYVMCKSNMIAPALYYSKYVTAAGQLPAKLEENTNDT